MDADIGQPQASRTRSRNGPLDGLRVLELGMLIAGPFGGRLLADLGADVVKIELPETLDELREWGRERFKGKALWWPVLSRNKRCITLDLRKTKGQELLLGLAEKSDVIIENFRPGTMDKWNLGYQRLSKVNPGIIVAHVSGFGQYGSKSQRPGFASVAEAMGGLRYITGFPDMPPPRLGISLGDSLAGVFAALGVLAAVYWRDGLGDQIGQEVDVSLLESCFTMLESAVPEYDLLKKVREPSGTGLEGVAPSNIFKSADDKWVVIAANNANLFRRLCLAMGRPDLLKDERYATHAARGQHQQELDDEIAKWANQHEAEALDESLTKAGIVCGPVYTMEDIFKDPHYREREMLLDHHDPELGTFKGPGVVPKFSRTPGGLRWTGPWKGGSHNEEILSNLLGLTAEEIESLKEQGVV